jgi:acetate kinase
VGDGSVLVVNAGSSSLKLRLLDGTDEVLATSDVELHQGSLDAADLTDLLAGRRPEVVAHRVVHGGAQFAAAVRVDDDVLGRIEALTDLAPIHQPRAVRGVRSVRDLLPDVPAVACFDTTFHRTLAPEAATYALPAPWRERWPLRRYGAHGLSHAYASRRAGELVGDPDARIVVCHLGSGASLCAVAGGRSVDTTMGFTPLEGLVMATRSGTVDPGLVLWLQRQGGLSADEVHEGLEHQGGLLGLSGESNLQHLVDGAGRLLTEAAGPAIDVWLHRLVAEIAAMVSALGGLDVLVLTGGVGEHQPALRGWAAQRLAYLGVEVDAVANASAQADREITAPGAAVRTFVLTAREDLQMAREAREVLADG